MAYYGFKPAEQAIQVGDNTIVSADIVDGVIVNADINASAAIALSKTQLVAGTGITLATNTLNVDAAQTQITSVGTIGTGVWQGTAVASAYLDADTAHLSGTQTFSGAKTFSSAVNVALSDASVSPSSDADDLVVENNGACGITIASAANSVGSLRFADSGASHAGMLYYSHASNFMKFYTDATERMIIDSSGNVGIGTSSPSLNVAGSTGDIAGTVLHIKDTSARADLTLEGQTGARLDLIDITGGSNTKWLRFSIEGDVGKFHSVNDDGAAFNEDNILVMDLASGKVGIGIAAPTSPLHIKGAPIQTSGARSAQLYIEDTTAFSSVQNSGIQFRQIYHTNGSITSTSAIVGLRTSTSSGNYGGALIFQTRANGADLADNMIIGADGKVGIGTSDPGAVLETTGSADDNWAGRFENTHSGGYGLMALIAGSSANEYALQVRSGSTHLFKVMGDGSATFAGGISGTNLTLNSSSPLKFTNSGTGTYNRAEVYQGQNNSSNNDSNGIFWERARLTDSSSAEVRKFTIGDRGGGKQFILNATGGLWIAGALTQNSDIRLKTNIVNIDKATDIISKLQPFHYEWNDKYKEITGASTTQKQIGLDSIEVKKVLPQAVSQEVSDKEGEKYDTVDYVMLVPVLIQALNESNKRIEALENA